jgi:hypothetical protein
VISGRVSVQLPVGRYLATFFSPTTGLESAAIRLEGGEKPVAILLSPFEQDVVLRVTREP